MLLVGSIFAFVENNLNYISFMRSEIFFSGPHYLHLQVVNRRGQGYGLPADIWSLGCTVLEMLTQKIPYSDLEWVCACFVRIYS